MGVCQLCGKESILQKSHVIPRSLIKYIKGGDSQLHTFERYIPSTYSNYDPKEHLMCRVCEQYLSVNYEQYGTRLLKNHKNVIKHDDYIEFKNFEYQKWYLYYLSIIWRASISSLDDFKDINLGGYNDILKHCILNDTLSLSETISIDECILISMFRVTDKSKKLTDSILKKIMMNILAVKENDDHLFFFMTNGFLVQYQLTSQILLKKKSGLKRSDASRFSKKNVKFIDITESKVLYENLNWLFDAL
tara:strand:+ start:954 stop:1697 length:744 start_codon:yes stop_codon:yes gene_type:complete